MSKSRFCIADGAFSSASIGFIKGSLDGVSAALKFGHMRQIMVVYALQVFVWAFTFISYLSHSVL